MGNGTRGNKRRTTRREQIAESSRKVGRVTRGVLIVVVIAVTAGGLPLLGYFGYRQVLESGYFAPKVTLIEGNVQVSDEEILDAARLRHRDLNLIELDTDEIETRVEAIPWIDNAVVETELPDTVHITVTERTMLGLVLDDQLYVVDTTGEIIKPWTDEPIEGAIVSGVDIDTIGAKAHVTTGFHVAQSYQAMGLEKWAPLAEVQWDDRLGITLFAGETEIRLGHDRYDERLRRLWQVFALLEARDARAEYVLLDMDTNLDQVAIKPYPKIVSAPPPEPDVLEPGDGDNGETQPN